MTNTEAKEYLRANPGAYVTHSDREGVGPVFYDRRNRTFVYVEICGIFPSKDLNWRIRSGWYACDASGERIEP